MYPILFRLEIYSYGVMLFLSFLFGFKIVEYRARKFGVDSDKITDLAVIIIISVIIGARLLFVILHWPDFANDLIGIIAFWRGGLGGLMFFGGFILAFVCGFIYVKHQKLPLLKMLDAITPALMLGEGLTRIGCFLNGCCFGKPTSSPFGIIFPPNSAAGATFSCLIHPTQLYSSLAGFGLFVVTLILEKKHLKDGVLFGVILMIYALFRFGVDFIRFYENTANFLVNQLIAIIIFIAALVFTVIQIKK